MPASSWDELFVLAAGGGEGRGHTAAGPTPSSKTITIKDEEDHDGHHGDDVIIHEPQQQQLVLQETAGTIKTTRTAKKRRRRRQRQEKDNSVLVVCGEKERTTTTTKHSITTTYFDSNNDDDHQHDDGKLHFQEYLDGRFCLFKTTTSINNVVDSETSSAAASSSSLLSSLSSSVSSSLPSFIEVKGSIFLRNMETKDQQRLFFLCEHWLEIRVSIQQQRFEQDGGARTTGSHQSKRRRRQSQQGESSNLVSSFSSSSSSSAVVLWSLLHAFCCLRNIRCATKAIIAINNKLRIRTKRASEQEHKSFVVAVDGHHDDEDVVVFEDVDVKTLKRYVRDLVQLVDHTMTTTKKKKKKNAMTKLRECCLDVSIRVETLLLSKTRLNFELAMEVIMACDEAYYQLYYHEITSNNNNNNNARGYYVPHPTFYFGSSINTTGTMMMTSATTTKTDGLLQKKMNVVNAAIQSIAVSSSPSSSSTSSRYSQLIMDRFGLLDPTSTCTTTATTTQSQQDYHPLELLHTYRFMETIELFHIQSQWTALSTTTDQIFQQLIQIKPRKLKPTTTKCRQKDNNNTKLSRGHKHVDVDVVEEETPAPKLLMSWRDSCRDFLCHLYGYATLSTQTIHVLGHCIMTTIQQQRTSIIQQQQQSTTNANESTITIQDHDIKTITIIELGAGTGYLARLIYEVTSIPIIAYDVMPTTTRSTNGSNNAAAGDNINEYHGLTPSFYPVRKCNSSSYYVGNNNTDDVFHHKKNGMRPTVLLLCYPPPDTSMALDAIRRFDDDVHRSSNNSNNNNNNKEGDDDDDDYDNNSNNLVVHIGEFQGLTGTRDFECYLNMNYNLIQRLPCLTWGTDATEVTVWKRKKMKKKIIQKKNKEKISQKKKIMMMKQAKQQRGRTSIATGSGDDSDTNNSSSSCSIMIPCIVCQTRMARKRCRLLRFLNYCSIDCFHQGKDERIQALAMSMIFIGDQEGQEHHQEQHHSTNISTSSSVDDEPCTSSGRHNANNTKLQQKQEERAGGTTTTQQRLDFNNPYHFIDLDADD